MLKSLVVMPVRWSFGAFFLEPHHRHESAHRAKEPMDLGYGYPLPSARPQLPISHRHQPRQSPARVGGIPWLSLTWKPLALLVLLAVAVSPLQAQDPDPAAGLPVCDRTEQVRDAIVAAVDGVSSCADVTEAHLAGITQLSLADESIRALRVGDLSGLAALEILYLDNNLLTELPSDIFTGLAALQILSLNNNNLEALPSGVFTNLAELNFLLLNANSLTALPAGLFSGLRALIYILLLNNPGSEDFLPIANAGADRVVDAGQIATLTATASDADPWGDNVSYAWAQIDNGGGVVTLKDGKTARPSFVMPAGATALEFELTVTGRGGVLYSDTDRVTVRYPSAVVPVCGRTEQVRDAIVAAVDGVGNCADITKAHLAGITQLFLDDESISALQADDFFGLSRLGGLRLGSNSLSVLPAGVFTGLTDLETLDLNGNSLTALSAGAFDGLTTLRVLFLNDNNLAALPAGIFSDTRSLVDLRLHDNPGSRGFLPIANAGADQTVDAGQIATLAATASDTDPWGDNVRYAWAQIDNGGGVATLMDADTARPSFVMPAGATALEFELTVTGLGGAGYADTDSVTVLDPSAVVPVCDRTEQVRDAIVAAVDGVSNCVDITEADLAGIAQLFLGDESIRALQVGDFSGLAALNSLVLDNNGLTELPPKIFGGLADLRALFLRGNGLAALPLGVFGGLTDLESLYLNANSLTALATGVFTGLTELETLELSGNSLMALTASVFAGLRELSALHLNDNSLTALPAGTFASLTALQFLHLNDNSLAALPAGAFAGLTALQSLLLNNNGLTALSAGAFAGLTRLRVLFLNDNNLAELPSGAFTGLLWLRSLNLRDNDLAELPASIFDGLAALRTLQLNNNNLAALPAGVFDDLYELLLLSLNANSLATLPAGLFAGLTELKALHLQDNPGGEGFLPIASAGADQVVEAGQIATLTATVSDTDPWGDNVSYAWAQIDNGGDLVTLRDADTALPSFVMPAGATALEFKLTVTGRGGARYADTDSVTVLNSSPFVPVCDRTEQVRDAIVAAVDGVSSCADITEAHLAAITELHMVNRGISALQADDFFGLSRLGGLRLGSNSLSVLPAGVFTGLTTLRVLFLNDNNLAALPDGVFNGLILLETLYLDSNGLMELPPNAFTGLAALKVLGLRDNSWTALPAGAFDGLTGLETLYLSSNNLAELPSDAFTGLASLLNLRLNDNNLAALPADIFSGTRALESLYLNSNLLTELPPFIFTGLLRLRSLNLRDNDLAELPASILDGLAALRTLQLNNNNLAALPAGVFDDLYELLLLSLNANSLTALPAGIFSGTRSLVDLRLHDNPGSRGFLPIANAGADQTVDAGQIATLAATASDTDPWGDNVRYAWAQIDNGGDLVTLKDAHTARPSFVVPEGATALEFELTVTGLGGAGYADTDSVTVLDPNAVVSVCGRTEQVRDAIVAAVDGVSDCAYVTEAQLADIPQLFFTSIGIEALQLGDFSGLAALQMLNLNNNLLTALPVGIFAGLTALEGLYLSDNNLTALSAGAFASLAELETLDLSGNSLTALPAGAFAGLTALQSLYLDSNSLAALPEGVFNGLILLETLYLDDNSLVELPPDTFAGLAALETLNLSGNSLMALSAGAFAGLTTTLRALFLNDNKLAALSTGAFAGLTTLRVLFLYGNNLAELPSDAFTGLTTLLNLRLDGNKLAALPAGIFSGTRALADLRLHDNPGSRGFLPIANAGVDQTIDAGQIVTLAATVSDTDPWGDNVSYAWAQIDNGGDLVMMKDAHTARPSFVVPEGATALEFELTVTGRGGAGYADTDSVTVLYPSAVVPVCDRTEWVRDAIVAAVDGVSNCANVTEADLDGITQLFLVYESIRALQVDDFSGLAALETLDLSGNLLTELPPTIFDGLRALYSLDLSNNSLTELPPAIFDGLRALSTLRLHDNRLTALPAGAFSSLTDLGFLSLNNNLLTELPPAIFDGLGALNILRLHGNRLTALPAGVFTGLAALSVLYLNSNSLAALPSGIFDRLAELEVLYLNNNNLTALLLGIFTGLSDLKTLKLSDNSLTELPAGLFSDLTELDYLSLSNNLLTELPAGLFSGLRVLTVLRLEGNSLYVLLAGAFAGLARLGILYLNDNSLTALPPSAFAGLAALDILYLNGNSLTELPAGAFAGLTALRFLLLDDNGLTALPADAFTGLTALRTLDLSNNHLMELPEGVFRSLTALRSLDLNDNSLTALTAGVFRGLTALRSLDLNDNSLTALTAGVFRGLTALRSLDLNDNSLTVLPAGLFSDLRVLRTLFLQNNPGSKNFLPIANAGAGQVVEAGQIATLRATASDTDPWGDNVRYAWSQIGNGGGVVTLMDADTARPSFVMPAAATALEFELTVTGRGGARYADTDSVTVLDPSAVVPVCDRTEQVRDAIVAAVDGVSNCADVTEAHLAGITQLFLADESIGALQVGDFFGLAPLETLDLSGNSLTALSADAFVGIIALEVLDLGSNSLSVLPAGVFAGFFGLEVLDLGGNSLSVLPAGVFADLVALEVLDLGGNSLSVLPAGVFADLARLNALHLGGNGLTALPAGVFGGLTMLRSLNLNENLLAELPPAVFNGLGALDALRLQENLLTTLPVGVFSDLAALVTLLLNDNLLTELPPGIFNGLSALHALHLYDNSLTALPAGLFSDLRELELLSLSGNSLTALPARLFSALRALMMLFLQDNPGSEDFLPIANAGAGQSIGAGHIVTLTATVSDADPWGDNVRYGWAQIDNSGNAVVLMGADTARPSFVMPAGATALEFELTVTGLGGARYADTDRVTVRLPAAVVTLSGPAHDLLPADATAIAGDELILVYSYSADDLRGRVLTGSIEVAAAIDGEAITPEIRVAGVRGEITVVLWRQAYPYPGEHELAVVLSLSATAEGFVLGEPSLIETPFSFLPLPPTVLEVRQAEGNQGKRGAAGSDIIELGYIFDYAADNRLDRPRAGLSVQVDIELCADAGGGCAILPGASQALMLDGDGSLTLRVDRTLAALSVFGEADDDSIRHGRVLLRTAGDADFAAAAAATTFSFAVAAAVVTLSGPLHELLPADATAIAGDVLSLVYSYSADDLRGRVLTGGIEAAASIDGLAITSAIEVNEDEGRGRITVVLRREKYPYPGEHELAVTLSLSAAAEGFVLGEPSSITTAFSFLPLPPTVLEVRQAEGNQGKRGAAGSDIIELGYIFDYAAGNRLDRPRAGLEVQVDVELCADAGYSDCSSLPGASQALMLDGDGSLTLRVDRTLAALSVFGEADDDSIRHGRVLLRTAGDADFAAAAATTTFSFAVAAAVVTLSGPVHELLPADATAIAGDVLSLVYSYSADELRGRVLTGSIEVAAAIDGLAITSAIEVDEDEGRGRITVVLWRQAYPDPGEHQLAVTLSLSAAAEGFVLGEPSSIKTTFSFGALVVPSADTVVTLSGPVPAATTDIAESAINLVYTYIANDLHGRVLTGSIEVAAAIDGVAVTPAVDVDEVQGRGKITVVLRWQAYPYPGEHELVVTLSAAAEGFVLGEPSSITTPFSFSPLPPTVLEVGQADGNQGKRGAAGSDIIELGYIFDYAADNRLNRPRAGLVVQVDVELCAAAGSGCVSLPTASQFLILDGNGSLTLRVDRTLAALSIFGEADADSIRHGRVLLRTAGDADFAAAAAATTFSFAVAAAVVTLSGPVHDLLPADATAIAGDALSLVYSYSADELRGRTLMGNIYVVAAVDGVAITPAVNYVDGARGEITIILSRAEYPELGEHLLAVSLSLSATAEGFVLAEPSSIATPFSFEALVVPDTVVTLSGPRSVATTDIVGGELSLVYSYSADDLHGRVLTGSIEVAASIGGVAITTSIEVDEARGRGEITMLLLRREYPEPGEHQLAVTLSLSAAAEGFVLGEPSSITTPFSFGALVVADADTVVTLSGPVHDLLPADATGISGEELGLVYSYSADELRGRALTGSIEVAAAIDGEAITPEIRVAGVRGEITVVLRREKYPYPGEHELAVALSAAAEGFVLAEPSLIKTTFSFLPLPPTVLEVRQADGNQGKRGAAGNDIIELGYIFDYAAGNRLDRPRAGLEVQVDVELCADAGYSDCSSLPMASQALILDGNGSLTLRVDRTAAALSVFGEADDDSIRHGRVLLRTAGDADFAATAATTTFSFAIAAAVVTLSGPAHDLLPADATAIAGDVLSLVYSYSADELRGRVLTGSIEVAAAIDGEAIPPEIRVAGVRGEITVVLRREKYPYPGQHELAVALSTTAEGFVLAEPSSIATTFSFGALVVLSADTVVTLSGPVPADATAIAGDALSLVYSYSADELRGRVLTGGIEAAATIDGEAITPEIRVAGVRGEITVVLWREKYPYPGEHELAVALSAAAEGFVLGEPSSITTAFSFLPLPPTVLEVMQAEGNQGKRGAAGSDAIELGYIFEYAAGNRLNRPRAGLSVQIDVELCADAGGGCAILPGASQALMLDGDGSLTLRVDRTLAALSVFGEADADSIRHGRVLLRTADDADFAAAAAATTFSFAVAAAVVTLSGPVHDLLPADATAIAGDALSLVYSYSADEPRSRTLMGNIYVVAAVDGVAITPAVNYVDGARGEITIILSRAEYPEPGEHLLAVSLSLSATATGFVLGETSLITTPFSFGAPAVIDTVVTLSGPVHDLLPADATGISGEELSLVYSYSADDLHGRVLTGSIKVAASIDGVAITTSIEVDEARGRGEITVVLQRREYPDPGEHQLAVTLSLSAADEGFVLGEPSSITTPFSFGALVVADADTVVTLSGPVHDLLPADATGISGEELSLVYSYSADELRGRALTGSIEVAASIDGVAITPFIDVDEVQGRGKITVVLLRREYPDPGEHELAVILSLSAAATGFVLGETSSISTTFGFSPSSTAIAEDGTCQLGMLEPGEKCLYRGSSYYLRVLEAASGAQVFFFGLNEVGEPLNLQNALNPHDFSDFKVYNLEAIKEGRGYRIIRVYSAPAYPDGELSGSMDGATILLAVLFFLANLALGLAGGPRRRRLWR